MNAPPWIFSTLVLVASFSGCFAEGPGPAAAEPSDSSTTSTPSATGNTSAPTTNTSAPPEPPVANFTVASSNATDPNLTAGVDLVLDASNSTDPAGGSLTFAWDLGDGNTTEGMVANHTYATEGNYTIVLNVTSDASGLTSQANQTLVIVAGVKGRLPVTFTDPSGDGTTDVHDIRVVTISDDEETLTVAFTVGRVQPGADMEQIVCYSIFILGTGKTTEYRYELFSELGTWRVYDYVAQANMPGAGGRIAGTGYEVTLPLSGVIEGNGIEFPLALRLEARGGECTFRGGDSNLRGDSAPNSGAVSYG